MNRLRGLLPVGGSDNGFARANTFGAALEAAIRDVALLDSVKEVRVTDSEVDTNSHGRGAIFYISDGVELATYYVRREALTLQHSGAEKTTILAV